MASSREMAWVPATLGTSTRTYLNTKPARRCLGSCCLRCCHLGGLGCCSLGRCRLTVASGGSEDFNDFRLLPMPPMPVCWPCKHAGPTLVRGLQLTVWAHGFEGKPQPLHSVQRNHLQHRSVHKLGGRGGVQTGRIVKSRHSAGKSKELRFVAGCRPPPCYNPCRASFAASPCRAAFWARKPCRKRLAAKTSFGYKPFVAL